MNGYMGVTHKMGGEGGGAKLGVILVRWFVPLIVPRPTVLEIYLILPIPCPTGHLLL